MADEKKRMKAKAQEFFEQADADGSGGLTKMELAKIVEKLGYDKTPGEIVSWFDDLDRDDDDKITLAEFVAEVIDKKPKSEVQEAELRCVFKDMDEDGKGTVSADELRMYIKEKFCYDIDDDKLEYMISSVDTGGDGNISYEEFLTSWKEM